MSCRIVLLGAGLSQLRVETKLGLCVGHQCVVVTVRRWNKAAPGCPSAAIAVLRFLWPRVRASALLEHLNRSDELGRRFDLPAAMRAFRAALLKVRDGRVDRALASLRK